MTVTTGVPATIPANDTTPAAAARTGTPAVAERSTPRWPAPQRTAGASNRRRRLPGPPTGHALAPPAPGSSSPRDRRDPTDLRPPTAPTASTAPTAPTAVVALGSPPPPSRGGAGAPAPTPAPARALEGICEGTCDGRCSSAGPGPRGWTATVSRLVASRVSSISNCHRSGRGGSGGRGAAALRRAWPSMTAARSASPERAARTGSGPAPPVVRGDGGLSTTDGGRSSTDGSRNAADRDNGATGGITSGAVVRQALMGSRLATGSRSRHDHPDPCGQTRPVENGSHSHGRTSALRCEHRLGPGTSPETPRSAPAPAPPARATCPSTPRLLTSTGGPAPLHPAPPAPPLRACRPPPAGPLARRTVSGISAGVARCSALPVHFTRDPVHRVDFARPATGGATVSARGQVGPHRCECRSVHRACHGPVPPGVGGLARPGRQAR
jgi:hypothetical protein